MGPRFSAEDSVFVLDADDVDRVDVQEVGGAPVRRQIGLRDLESNARGIRMTPPAVVHRDDEAVELGKFAVNRVAQIGRERCDAALAWGMCAEQRDLPDTS